MGCVGFNKARRVNNSPQEKITQVAQPKMIKNATVIRHVTAASAALPKGTRLGISNLGLRHSDRHSPAQPMTGRKPEAPLTGRRTPPPS